MEYRRKTLLFAILAALCAASSAPLAANSSVPRGVLVLTLVAMGLLLFVTGYYAGRSRNLK